MFGYGEGNVKSFLILFSFSGYFDISAIFLKGEEGNKKLKMCPENPLING